MNKERVKQTAVKLFMGEVTIQKRELWLAGALCLLAGIVIGLAKAPWTHGVTIGSNNGNNNGNNQDCCFGIEDCEDADDCEA